MPSVSIIYHKDKVNNKGAAPIQHFVSSTIEKLVTSPPVFLLLKIAGMKKHLRVKCRPLPRAVNAKRCCRTQSKNGS